MRAEYAMGRSSAKGRCSPLAWPWTSGMAAMRGSFRCKTPTRLLQLASAECSPSPPQTKRYDCVSLDSLPF